MCLAWMPVGDIPASLIRSDDNRSGNLLPGTRPIREILEEWSMIKLPVACAHAKLKYQA